MSADPRDPPEPGQPHEPDPMPDQPGDPVDPPIGDPEEPSPDPMEAKREAHAKLKRAVNALDAPDDVRQEPEVNPDASAPVAADHVRVAGRKEMNLPPPQWDEVDETSDESFPASDPPGNY